LESLAWQESELDVLSAKYPTHGYRLIHVYDIFLGGIRAIINRVQNQTTSGLSFM
jgi:hypothetical protein